MQNIKNLVKLGLLQLCSKHDKVQNLQVIESLVKQASEKQAKICFLPEGFAFIAKEDEKIHEYIEDQFIVSLQSLAKQYNIWMALGGFVRKVAGQTKFLNTYILLDNNGKIITTYDKVHLFNLNYGQKSINESNLTEFGQQIPEPISTPVGLMSMSICYDLRFPEFYRIQALKGAQILTVPAAFTKATGEAHWHILLRARAIENQCFVVAPAQCGEHFAGRSSYGHSLIVNPWGQVICDMGPDRVGVEIVEIDLEDIERARQRLSAMKNIRSDLYNIQIKEKKQE